MCTMRNALGTFDLSICRVVRRATYMILALGLVASGAASTEALAADPPRPEVVFRKLGYSDDEVAAVRAGGIVSKARSSAVETELRAAVAMILPVPFDDIRSRLEANAIAPVDSDLISQGTLSATVVEGEWREVTLGARDTDELGRLLKVKPGDTFNLSTSEIGAIQTALKDKSAADVDAISAAYRRVLQDRFVSYLERGLDGVSPYDRGGGKESSAARDMREVLDKALPFLRDEFPKFAAAIDGYPKVDLDGYLNRYSWVKTPLEGRSVIILSHTLAEIGSDHILGVVRQYYVGHTYNAGQSLWLVYREGNGTLAFQINSTTTDQITGLFSSMAQKVGKKRIREALETHFKKLRAHSGTETREISE